MGSLTGSNLNSFPQSRHESNENVNANANEAFNKQILHNGLNSALKDLATEEEDDDEDIENKSNMPKTIAQLLVRQRKERNQLETDLKKELNDCSVAFDAKMDELNETQKKQLEILMTEQERQLKEMIEAQEKEIIFEETMNENEMRMLIERRILNSVLETVSDGIIGITTSGIVIRFNHAAEVIFGYKANEILGKNIKLIVPQPHNAKHDSYLKNYLSTGVRKVIGIGQKLIGRRKDGTLVPVFLAVSEVKEHGQHMFTGIVHDLTDEVNAKNVWNLQHDQRKEEIKACEAMIQKYNNHRITLLKEILPPVVSAKVIEGKRVNSETFESASVLFFDIVGYEDIASSLPAQDNVEILNQLHYGIDQVISQYEAFKCQSTGIPFIKKGVSFQIASGLPNRNKNHATELVQLGLHIIKTIRSFEYKSNPIKLCARVGMHSGEVTAGIVGTDIPKYYLTGKTIQLADEVRNSSLPGRFHITSATEESIQTDNTFKIEASKAVLII
jgi:PAS domain S-box-containing protein